MSPDIRNMGGVQKNKWVIVCPGGWILLVSPTINIQGQSSGDANIKTVTEVVLEGLMCLKERLSSFTMAKNIHGRR